MSEDIALLIAVGWSVDIIKVLNLQKLRFKQLKKNGIAKHNFKVGTTLTLAFTLTIIAQPQLIPLVIQPKIEFFLEMYGIEPTDKIV